MITDLRLSGPKKAAPHLLVAKGNAPFGQVIRGHFNIDPIAHKNTNAKLAHFTRRASNDFVIILKLNPKHRVWELLGYDACKFKEFFFCHISLAGQPAAPPQASFVTRFHGFTRLTRAHYRVTLLQLSR